MPEPRTEVSISGILEDAQEWVRGVLVVGSVGVVLYLLWDIARLFLAAALIAYLLDPIVRRLQGTVGRTSATLLVMGTLAASLVAISIGITPVLQQQVETLRASVDPERVWNLVDHLEAQLSAFSTWLGGDPVSWELRESVNRQFGWRLFSRLQYVVGAAVNTLIVPFLAVFLLRDGPQIKRGLIQLVPNRYFEFSLEAIHKIDVRLGNYLRGIMVQNIIVGGLAIGVFWILNVPSFILLGLFIGLTNFIPYFGPLIGGGLVVLVQAAHTGSAQMAVFVLAAILALQVVDEALIVPVVFGTAVDLHPLEILLALWIAAKFFGVLGVVLAIPVASVGKVTITEATSLIHQYRFGRNPG